MKKTLQAVVILISVLMIMVGCTSQENKNVSGNIPAYQNGSAGTQSQNTKYAKSPEAVVQNYMAAVNNRDEKAALSCAGIQWDNKLAGFWQTEDYPEEAVVRAKNIVYEADTDFTVVRESKIKEWFENADHYGLNLEYKFDDIKSYGVVYFTFSVAMDGETYEHNAAFAVIETNKGWFLISVPIA